VVIELHENPTTLTHYAKGLRSLGIATHTFTLACFDAPGRHFDTARVVMLVPDASHAAPSPGVCRALQHCAAADTIRRPVIALVHAAQHARRVDWLAAGAQVLVQPPLSTYTLAQQIRAVIEWSGPMPLAAVHEPSLTRIERRILQLIASHPGRPFSRAAILRHIYDDRRVVCERTVDAHIKNLRRKMHAICRYAVIRSIYGAGYLIDFDRSTPSSSSMPASGSANLA
jgi:hypothetical protein